MAKVEVLTLEGCPNAAATRELVGRVVSELEGSVELEHVDVPSPDAAEALRFLGSPTVRVDGRDIEPGAEERTDYVLACRIYRTAGGLSGVPEERWLREALAG